MSVLCPCPVEFLKELWDSRMPEGEAGWLLGFPTRWQQRTAQEGLNPGSPREETRIPGTFAFPSSLAGHPWYSDCGWLPLTSASMVAWCPPITLGHHPGVRALPNPSMTNFN